MPMTSFSGDNDQPRDASGQFAATATRATDDGVLGGSAGSDDVMSSETHRLAVNAKADELSDQERSLVDAGKENSAQMPALKEQKAIFQAYALAANARKYLPGAATVALDDGEEMNSDGSMDKVPESVYDKDGAYLGEFNDEVPEDEQDYYAVSPGGYRKDITRWDWARNDNGDLNLAAVEDRARRELYPS